MARHDVAENAVAENADWIGGSFRRPLAVAAHRDAECEHQRSGHAQHRRPTIDLQPATAELAAVRDVRPRRLFVEGAQEALLERLRRRRLRDLAHALL